MKIIVSGFLIFVSICFLALWYQKPVNMHSLLGKWEGKNTQGKIEVTLTVDPSDLAFEYVESGKSHKNSYILSEGARSREIKIDGFEEKFLVNFIDADTMYLGLSEAGARQVSAPVISMVTYHKKHDY